MRCQSTVHAVLLPQATRLVTLPCGCTRHVCADCAIKCALQQAVARLGGHTTGHYTCPLCFRTTETHITRLYTITVL